jgi:hypothetical protein
MEGHWLLLEKTRVVRTIAAEDIPAARAGLIVAGSLNGLAVGLIGIPWRNGSFEVGQKNSPDSNAIARYNLVTRKIDTIARLRPQPRRMTATMDADGNVTSTGNAIPPRFSTGEVAVPFTDGWLAVGRLEPYRVDWRSPTGQWTLGKPLPFIEILIDDREIEAYEAREAAQEGKTAAERKAAQDAYMASRVRSGRPPLGARATVRAFPPFQEYARHTPAPDGRVLIERMQTADHPERRYDIVNRRGTLDGYFTLGENETLLGAGKRSIYVLEIDDNGIQWIRRHPWPAVR